MQIILDDAFYVHMHKITITPVTAFRKGLWIATQAGDKSIWKVCILISGLLQLKWKKQKAKDTSTDIGL